MLLLFRATVKVFKFLESSLRFSTANNVSITFFIKLVSLKITPIIPDAIDEKF